MASLEQSDTADTELVPREYQNEIFAEARQRNIIAVMDTGTGKTLIAVSLIKWITTRITEDTTRKVILFLVPKVTLVNQQQAVVSSQTALKVRGYHGEMKVEYWVRARWEQEFAEVDVLVMTPQILVDLLRHAHWSLDKVTLIIFDEAHHCQRNHPYNQIMREHYFTLDVERRPKVFGMTASPLWNTKQPIQALRGLEGNMSAKVLGVKDNITELQEHAAKPVEVILRYPPTPDSFRRYPFPLMSDLLMRAGPAITSDLEPIRKRYGYTLDVLGLCGAEYYLSALAPHILAAAIQKRRKQNGVFGGSNNNSEGSHLVSELEHLRSQFVEHAARAFQSAFEVKPEWVSPRVRMLAQLLETHYAADGDCQSIVFADQRHIVMCLAWILPKMSSLKGRITTTYLMGHGDAGSGTSQDTQGMNFDMQVQVVKGFRDRNVNVLIATSVAEEGLDFQPCNLVVRFDPLQTIVSYTQSRGRARQKASTYVVMQPEASGPDKYVQYLSAEPELKQVYQNRSGGKLALDETEEDVVPDGDLRLRERYVTAANAKLAYDGAIALLALLCSTLRLDDFTPIMNPVYEEIGGFRYSVTLPSALPVPRAYLVYKGPLRSSKKEAKRAVAFEAVRALHRLGCYDDYLYPIRGSTDDEGEDADGKRFSPLDLPDQIQTTAVDVWGDPWRARALLRCYPLVHQEQECAYVGLVTAADLRLEDVNHHVDTLADIPALASGLPLSFTDSDEQHQSLELMQRYTLFLKEWAISRRPTESKLVYFLVPLLPDSSPDWSAMRSALEQPLSSDWSYSNADAVAGQILVVEKMANCRAQVMLRVRSDLNPSSPSSSGFQCCRRGCKSFVDHVAVLSQEREAKWAKRVASGQSIASRIVYSYPRLPLDEPMVEIQAARLDKNTDVRRIIMVPLSHLKRISIPLGVFRIAEKLPSLTYHISSVFRAREAATALQFPTCPLDKIIEALSVPRTGSLVDYNRLESLGDTFLKLCTSIYIFNKFPHRHEGQLHVLRKNSVRNLYLQGKSWVLGIHRFAIGERLSTNRRWLPSTIDDIVYEGCTPYIKLKIPRKFLPDTVESLLGASYLHWGIDGVLYTGRMMGLCFGGEISWSERYGVESSTSRRTPPGFKQLEENLRYIFRDPSLLLEAMTHATFQFSETPSYDRLEFLGDAVIEAYILECIFIKYPTATAAQLTWMKCLLVCNSLLGALAIRKLCLHKHLLAFSSALDRAVAKAVEEVRAWSYDDLVLKWWEFSPPKVLNDTLEATVGAVLIDSNYNMTVVKAVLDGIFEDVLPLARPNLPRHPVTELMMWSGKSGCGRVRYKKSSRDPNSTRNDTYAVIVHGVEVSCVTREKRQIAKCVVSSDALAKLSDSEGEFALHKLCNCAEEREEKARQRAEEKRGLKQEEAASRAQDSEAMDVDRTSGNEGTGLERAPEGTIKEAADIVNAYLMDTVETDPERVGGKVKDDTEEGFAEIGKVLRDVLEPETDGLGEAADGEGDDEVIYNDSEDEDVEMS